MAIRELIANAINESIVVKIEIKRLSKEKWSITNIGNEIKPENFVINEGDKSRQKGISSKSIRECGRVLFKDSEYFAKWRKY